MIKDTLILITKFVRTGIISAGELIIWLAINNNEIYLMLWNTDYIRPTIILGLISIPVISAIREYQQKKRDINQLISRIEF